MTVKKLLLFAFVLTLSLAKAQTPIKDFDPKLLVGFDEQKLIQEAKKKGVADNEIRGYINCMKSKYILDHNPHLKHTEAEYHKKREVFVNLTPKNSLRTSSSVCQNGDFSMLTYANWTGDICVSPDEVTGVQYPSTTWSATGINGDNGNPIIINTDPNYLTSTVSTDRHVIMNTPIGAPTTNPANAFANGYDPVCQNPSTNYFDLPMVPSNGATSLRLGSEYANQTAQKITYAITITPLNTQFTYQYAVILNDGGHNTGDQPAFVFTLRDGSGNQIGGSCGQYIKDANSGNPNTDTTFHQSIAPDAVNFNGSPVYYRNWHTETVDLTPYTGTVYAEFQTLDCTFSAHFAYAYISATCGALSATVSGFCGGQGTAVMNAPPGFTSYQWYGPNSNSTIITGADSAVHIAHNALPNDSFFVHMISASGCTTKLKVTVIASNIAAVPASTSSCKGGNNGSASVSITGGGSFSYLWTPGNQTTSTATNLAPGTYSVVVTDNTHACPNKDTTVVVAAIQPNLTTTTAQLCGTQLSPPLHAPAGATGPFNWTVNTNTASIGASSVLNYTPSVSASDYFTVTYIDPTTHCEDSLKTTLTQVILGFSTSQANPCHGGSNGSISLTDTIGNPFVYVWTVNGGAPDTVVAPFLDNNLSSGVYHVVVHPSGNASCSYSVTVNLVNGALPPPTLVTVKGCAKDTINISPPLPPGSTNHWYSSSVALPNPDFSAATLPVFGALNYNNVTYTDTIYSAAPNFCVSVYKATVKTESFKLTISTPEKITCHNDSNGAIKVTASSEVNGPIGKPYSFAWAYPSPYTSPGVINAGTGVPQTSQEAGLHAGTYTILVKAGNCEIDTTFTLTNPPLLPYDSLNTFYCPKDSLALIVADPGHPKYTWLDNHIVVTAIQNINYNNDSIWVPVGNVNNYWVAFTVGGCPDTANILFTYPSLHALRPDTLVNIFTPNGDNRNELFYPFYGKSFTAYDVSKQTETYQLYVYNRWGKLVFSSTEYLTAWDGKDSSGTPQDDGTYFFIVKYQSNCSSKADIIEKKGYVQLLR